jgi:inhibitor of cysteine peptidase
MFPNGSSHPRSKLIAYSLLGIICGALFVNAASEMGITWGVQPHAASGVFGELQQFRSENQLKEFLKTNTSGSYYGEYWGWLGFPMFLKAVPSAQSVDAASGGVKYDYSQTNIQVEGVDEADVIKTDGKYIYYAHNQAVYIALAYPPSEAKLLSKITVEQGAGEIYIYGNKLVLFT